MSKHKIAVIEDQKDILDIIVYNLRRENYKVLTSNRGDDGLEVIRKGDPSLILLDIMLPGIDGLEVCRQLKSDPLTEAIPIIIVSARGQESDVVLGLGMGADDYICKPFSPRELLARLKAVLRRTERVKSGSTGEIRIKNLSIDINRHEVRVNGNLLTLTATEFRMLHQLASQPGRAFTREQLLNKVIGNDAVVVDRNIDVHIR